MTLFVSLVTTLSAGVLGIIFTNLFRQLFLKDSKSPPVVWHWFPVIGSTVSYGQDPYAFFFKCRRKYGDIFTFTLLGMKVTVYLGSAGNNFILNGKLKDLNAEEIYGPLTTPIFGKGVVYDVDNSRFMDQKRLLKEGFSSDSLRSYFPQFITEVEKYLTDNSSFQSPAGICDISTVMSELALYCAASSLQGREVRELFDSDFATLYRHLDDAFAPINFMMPGLPIPVNKRRDHAQAVMSRLYVDIIQRRRAKGARQEEPHDMLWALIDATYKDGTDISEEEIANLMIALLMGGQHNTAASGTWIMLELANHPHIIEDLYTEQQSQLGSNPLTYDSQSKLKLHEAVIKETLRLHSPIHSVMRKVKSPMQIPSTDMVVPAGHVLLAAPSFLSRTEEHFPNALSWNPHRWITGSTGPTEGAQDQADAVDYGYGMVYSKAAHSPYLPFGAGRHRCIGETFAYTQLTAILATLVRHLTWEQVDASAPVPATDYSSMFSRPMHPATIHWRKRNSAASSG